MPASAFCHFFEEWISSGSGNAVSNGRPVC